MNEEDDDNLLDEVISYPRMAGKSSIIDQTILNSDHWQNTVMNQMRVNSPTAGMMQVPNSTATYGSTFTDTFASAPRRPDFERIREHLVEDLDHAFTYDEKFGDVIAMPKAVAQALLNYLNWELQGGVPPRNPQRGYPGSIMQVLEQMQTWMNTGPRQSEIRNLQARMPRVMDPNMYPLIKLLDMLHEARFLRG